MRTKEDASGAVMDWVKDWQEFYFDHYDFRSENVTYNHPLHHSLDAIDKIKTYYPPPYTLMVSGGIDSQAMIYAWLLSKIKFNVVSIKYVSDNIWFNDYDLMNLEIYRNKFNFTLEYRESDILNFFDGKFYQIAEEFNCSSPQICSHIYNASLIEEGTIIQSGNFLGINQVPLNNPILALHRYAKKTKRFIPYFFLSTPNLAYSAHNFLKNTSISNPYQLKMSLYKDNGFEIIPESRSFSGFEKVKAYYKKKFSDKLSLKNKLHAYPNPSREVFDVLLRYPLLEKYDTKNIKFHTNKFQ